MKRPSFISKPYESIFFEWISPTLSDNVTCVMSYKGGHGLQASGVILKNAVLASVSSSVWEPYSALRAVREVSINNPIAFSNLLGISRKYSPQQAENLVKSVSLAFNLISDKNKDFPYIQFLRQSSFPSNTKAIPHPLQMSDGYIALLGDCSLANKAIKSRQHFYGTIVDAILGPNYKDKAAFTWAMGTVLSRALSGNSFPFTLVPGLDLANHSPQPNSKHEYDSTSGLFTLTATKDIAEGEEICISYGTQRDNISMIALYGFMDPDNNNDVLIVPLQLHSKDSKGLNNTSQPSVGTVPVPINLTTLLNLPEDRRRLMRSVNTGKDINQENIETVLRVCLEVLHPLLTRVRETDMKSNGTGDSNGNDTTSSPTSLPLNPGNELLHANKVLDSIAEAAVSFLSHSASPRLVDESVDPRWIETCEILRSREQDGWQTLWVCCETYISTLRLLHQR
eukprot:gene358-655_t